MHLLAATPGSILDGSQAIDLGQSPGEVVLLSAADTEIAALAAAYAQLAAPLPTLRLANVRHLGHNLSVDLYIESVVRHAKIVVVRLLGGVSYWSYGVERLVATCSERSILLALVPGDDQPDAELANLSNLAPHAYGRLWRYLLEGGLDNARNFLRYAAALISYGTEWLEPVPLLRAGLYWPGKGRPELADLRTVWRKDAPTVAVIFYRALLQAGDLAPIDALIDALKRRGINPLPIYVASLKDPVSADLVRTLLRASPPAAILNATGFSVASIGGASIGARVATPFEEADCPVIQVVLAGGTERQWRSGTRGLSASDLAMNVALPEVDGRILGRAISFKSEAQPDRLTQCPIVVHAPILDRVEFTADLALKWSRLRQTAVGERRVAVVLANYPNRDGRLGNGVGLDTPAATIKVLRSLSGAGYRLENIPPSASALIARLSEGPTNNLKSRKVRQGGIPYPLSDYAAWFERLPARVRDDVTSRWGEPQDDPFVRGKYFRLAACSFGNVVIAIQPARGYNIDPQRTYHDAALVPPHGYLAFYAWLRELFDAHAVVHMGKHGNLEWLPGKALALSAECYPEVAFGPLPHLYPFIVNDPGEGSQAKRRAQAVIVDHLTPPLTRAESYGPLVELEQLVDEYYEAAGVDPRRLKLLAEQILELARRIGLDRDCGIDDGDRPQAALAKLDNYLCELKELQIRDGLHVFGEAPHGQQLTDLLVALARLPRSRGEGKDASLLRALAADLGVATDFDPLDCRMGEPWTGSRPSELDGPGIWRTKGDTVERLEQLSQALVSSTRTADRAWRRTSAVLEMIEKELRPMLESCGRREIAGLLAGLDGRFVEPGSSGAPTRGRLDVLPTGRNFYSVDSRTVPTPAAWQLGWNSAALVIERFRQDQGTWPKSLALSAWGTANMRTGGDDIAQALALMGVRPTWDAASRRVTGFEILPLSILDRPRVDVTLRVSGFFRDAFPSQIDLIDSAARAVAALDEAPELNPLAARVALDAAHLMSQGNDEESARRRAGFRVFGSRPGAYGAGLQALIDERGWQDDGDLARAYLAWGGYAYGAGAQGSAEHRLFQTRLSAVEGVLHNQDNREHDLLDSDDYYQFEGGITATVRHFSGRQPAVYHNDHARPERPQVRSLDEEVARVVRARVVNPKWIKGVMRHGYKGAFEMAATVDYIFAFAATARAVRDHHFDAVYEAYLADDDVRGFLLENNPAAAQEIAERLIEAQERGLWRPRSNSAYPHLASLANRSMENAR